MKLSALYIPPQQLNFIFGNDHKGITINLGGKYHYDITSEEDLLRFDKGENKNFIRDFWGNNISLISAIVGANGTGKTSLLRVLIEELSSNPKARNCILVYEDTENVFVRNETELHFSNESEVQFIENKNELNEKILYYSPNLDYDLIDINSPISLASYHKQSLSDYYLENIKRHLFFLKDQEVISAIKQSYRDFPFYSNLVFKAKSIYKSDFEKVYIQTTLGNKLYKIRNQLLDKVDNNDSGNITLNKDQIEVLFDESGTIQDELKALWETYPNSNQSKQQYVNGNVSFLQDVEVNILSYLVLEDTFSLDGDVGTYPFSNILQAESFDEKLTHFLRKFIIQASEVFYNSLNRNNVSIEISNTEQLKIEVQNLSNPNRTFRQVDFETKARNVLKQIELIESINEFYKTLLIFIKQDYCSEIEGGFEANIEKADIELFNSLIGSYENMLSKLYWSNLGGVLEVKSNKKLSTGEKSLLDMYASIYDYLKRYESQDHMYSKNCVLLLDEPEQGYHPLWKKKFIQALTATLPVLFNANKIITQLQVIFTTHDPLTLSDIPKDNIVYLTKDENGITELASKQAKKSFGANINDLLADSFFIEGSLMGDFVEDKIKETIEWINKVKQYPRDIPIEKKEYYKRVISIIEEPVIRIKLSEMLDEVLGENPEFEREMIRKEINYLINKMDSL